MATLISITEVQQTGITLRPNEAVAIVQQLIHNPVETDSPIPSSVGRPSPEDVYVDDEGFVTCHACESTPAVSEIATLLQTLLPPGTPAVPGALRYTIARALRDVDAPPFGSVDELSEALARFERGNRTAVVRALVARAQSVCLDRMRLVRDRQLMPTPTEFRREQRAADARYYELVGAGQRRVIGADMRVRPYPPRGAGERVVPETGTRVRPYALARTDQHIVPEAETRVGSWTVVRADPSVGPGIDAPAGAGAQDNPPPERRRVSTLSIGVAIGLCLIRVGEFLHTRSTPFRAAVAVTQPAPDRDPTPVAPPPQQDAARAPSLPAPVPVATTGSRVEKVAKPVAKPVAKRSTVRRAPPVASPRAPRAKGGVMDRAPLRWLRNAFTVRSEPL